MTFRTVHLHGAAAIAFGGPYRFEAETPRDVLRALLRMKKGFRQFMEQAEWRIVRGPLNRGIESDLDMLALRFGRCEELHLIPVASGAGKGKGIGKALLGVAIIGGALALAPWTAGTSVYSGGIAIGTSGGGLALSSSIGFAGITYANIAMVGAGLVLGGVSQLLAPNPKVGSYGDREDANNRPSFLFNGPVNVAELGNVIPVIYGKDVEVGTVVGAAGIYVEEIPAS